MRPSQIIGISGALLFTLNVTGIAAADPADATNRSTVQWTADIARGQSFGGVLDHGDTETVRGLKDRFNPSRMAD